MINNHVISIIDRFQNIESLDALHQALSDCAQDFGFNKFILGKIPRPGTTLEDSVFSADWDPEWVLHYLRNDYLSIDPIPIRSFQSDVPFEWGELKQSRLLTKDARMLLDDARSIGMRDGFCIPVFGPAGAQDCLSFAGDKNELSDSDKSILYLAGIYAASQARRLRGMDRPNLPTPLSDREVECLKWTSHGKTAWEISVILSISQNTVESYLSSAIKKLGATNRVQAVAEALRRNVIT